MIARINEIFFSYQGEGPYQGMPQIFIRFSGCNMKCMYCDTEHTYYKKYTIDELLKDIPRVDVHSISITGGEPLCQTDFLIKFLPRLNQRIYPHTKNFGVGIYLETNGVLYEELKLLLPYVDIISMDFKLPSSTGERAFWPEHSRFLRTASKKEVFVKVVITDNTTLEDLQTAVGLIEPNILLVLQPAGAARVKLLEFQRFALRRLDKVEIIPQMHKLLGIR